MDFAISKNRIYRLAVLVVCGSFISACASIKAPVEAPWEPSVRGDTVGNPELINNDEVVVKNLPKSKRGNPPAYRVFGETYRVMDSAENFREWGVASWYGKKFHGRETSSGEIYDMHQMTAAHKHLPIPTYVKVTRVDNDQSIIVKVNDRGPFVGDRVIDLSFAAATELGMVESGKTDVYIEALSTHHVIEPLLTEPGPYSVEQQAALLAAEPQEVAVQELVSSDVFIQVGAFSQEPNARRMMEKVQTAMTVPVEVNVDRDRRLHLVQVGPMTDELSLEEAIASLSAAGIDSFTFVSANP